MPLQEVGSVHSSRSHLCQDLVRGRSGQRAFRDFEYVRPAGFANRYGAHGRWHGVCHRRSPGICDLHFPNISLGRRNRAAAPGCPEPRRVSIASPEYLMAWTGSAPGREPNSSSMGHCSSLVQRPKIAVASSANPSLCIARRPTWVLGLHRPTSNFCVICRFRKNSACLKCLICLF